MGRLALVLCACLLLAASASGPPRAPVQIEMKNVRLHLDGAVVLDVHSLRGEMISRTSAPPVFDDSRSYVLHVATADIAIDMASLSALLNKHVFAYEGAPLSDIQMSTTADGRLEQKATLHKGVPVPVAMIASVSATPDGRIALHVESMKAAGVPAKGLMSLFGLKV